MKKLIFLLSILSFILSDLSAQKALQGMRYQAVVRDLEGSVLENEKMTVHVDLLQDENNKNIIYSETHEVSSNAIGLLNLVIGEGSTEYGVFSKVPWNNNNIWIRISIKTSAEKDFQLINTSQLYSVPYALYAETAGEILRDDNNNSRASNIGNSGNNWSLDGNRDSQENNNGDPILGTTDDNPLVMATNNEPRIILSVDGDANLKENSDLDQDLNVDGDVMLNSDSGDVVIGGDLKIDNSSVTLLTGALEVDGASAANGLLVDNMSSTALSGSLLVDKDVEVDGIVDLNSNLNVNGPVNFSGSLLVEGKITLGGGLEVLNMAPTHLTGTLDVDKDMSVNGTTTLNDGLDVNNMNSSTLSGTLRVAKASTLMESLTIENMSPTDLSGTLEVGKTMNVDQATTLNGGLDVAGQTTFGGAVELEQMTMLTAGLTVQSESAGDLILFDNTTGGGSDGVAIQIQKENTNKSNNFMTFYRGDGQEVAGRIEGYQFGDIQNIPAPTGDEIWTFVCLAIADYNPITIFWTQMATQFNIFGYAWNNITTPSFDIPDVPPFEIPDVPALAIPDIPAFVIDDVPSFNIPNIPGVVIPNLGPINIAKDLCTTVNVCVCPCSITTPLDFDCCCVDEEVCLIPAFQLFPEINIPDFPGIVIPNFPGIPIPDFNGIPIPDFNGIPIPDFPGLVIPEVPSINLSQSFGELPTIPTFNDILVEEGICPDEDIFDPESGYFRRLLDWAFEHRLHSLASASPVALAGSALSWAATTYVLDDGVVYGSKGADYAEYLPKLDPTERFMQGEVVGVFDGKISRNTKNADQVLAISSNPIVLGNLPNEADMSSYEKTAFLGQVAVYVKGSVSIGDYIIPSGNNNGIGIGVNAHDLTIEMLPQVIGKAWSEHTGSGISIVNTSFGLRPTEVSVILKNQGATESKIQEDLDKQVSNSNSLLNDVELIKQNIGLSSKFHKN